MSPPSVPFEYPYALKRPSKEEIKAAIAKLKEKPKFSSGSGEGKDAQQKGQNTERKTKTGF